MNHLINLTKLAMIETVLLGIMCLIDIVMLNFRFFWRLRWLDEMLNTTIPIGFIALMVTVVAAAFQVILA